MLFIATAWTSADFRRQSQFDPEQPVGVLKSGHSTVNLRLGTCGVARSPGDREVGLVLRYDLETVTEIQRTHRIPLQELKTRFCLAKITPHN